MNGEFLSALPEERASTRSPTAFTGRSGVSDDLVVLFRGRLYPHRALEMVENDLDAALKTLKFCGSCTGIDRCVMGQRGWQAFYDDEDSKVYGYKYPCFRYSLCRYWHEAKREESVKPRFRERTFDSFEVTEENREAFEACSRYAERFDRMTRKGLLLMGPPGTGKTHLAVSIHRAVLQKGIASIFVNMPDLVAELLKAFKQQEESLTYLAALEKKLVVVDDLGAERLRDWVQEYIYRLINERYERMLPLIVTTNCSIEELEERIGTAAVDRLAEMCEIKVVEGRSWRRKV